MLLSYSSSHVLLYSAIATTKVTRWQRGVDFIVILSGSWSTCGSAIRNEENRWGPVLQSRTGQRFVLEIPFTDNTDIPKRFHVQTNTANLYPPPHPPLEYAWLNNEPFIKTSFYCCCGIWCWQILKRISTGSGHHNNLFS